MDGVESFDSIVIGAGQAGKPLASDLAEAGRRTALVEREAIGGTCINRGCTPTKTMVASARVAWLARRAAEYGVPAPLADLRADMAVVRRRKQKVVDGFRRGSEKWLRTLPALELVFGEASFLDARTVAVRLPDGKTRRLRAERIFINTGARPDRPALPGLESLDPARVLDSTSVMELDALPEHLLVLGGGYIAVEFGQMFRRFGSRVTLVQRRPQLLEREDPDVAEEVAKVLREDGVELLLSSSTARLERAPGGAVSARIATPEGERTVAASHLLLATGRVPNTDRLNLAAAGLAADARGFVPANERLESAVPGIYVLGDVKGGPAFTHISYDDYRILRANLIEGGNATTAGRPVPYVVFLDPELARVGLSEREARAAGHEVRVARVPMAHVARAIECGETRGFIKALADRRTDQLLGVTVLGVAGGELMSTLQVAMMGCLTCRALRDAIFAHPTLAEAINLLLWSLEE